MQAVKEENHKFVPGLLCTSRGKSFIVFDPQDGTFVW